MSRLFICDCCGERKLAHEVYRETIQYRPVGKWGPGKKERHYSTGRDYCGACIDIIIAFERGTPNQDDAPAKRLS